MRRNLPWNFHETNLAAHGGGGRVWNSMEFHALAMVESTGIL